MTDSESHGSPRNLGPRKNRADVAVRVTPNAIKLRRMALGMSQRDMGLKFDPPLIPQSVSQFETNEKVSKRNLLKICQILQCKSWELSPDIQQPLSDLPEKVLSMVRADHPDRWVPNTDSDYEIFDTLWEGGYPGSADLGLLVDRAEQDGIPVLLRTDLPVKPRNVPASKYNPAGAILTDPGEPDLSFGRYDTRAWAVFNVLQEVGRPMELPEIVRALEGTKHQFQYNPKKQIDTIRAMVRKHPFYFVTIFEDNKEKYYLRGATIKERSGGP